jgi:hypothetical protein
MSLRPLPCLALLCSLLLLAPGTRPQESAAVFDAPVLVADHFQRFEELLDLDGDGDLDVFGWWWNASASLEELTLVGWLNDGNGRLVESWSQVLILPGSNDGAPESAAVGDVDGDARDDFALGFDDDVFVYTSNGAAPPTLVATVPNGEDVDDIALVDVGGDGQDDLVVRGASMRLYVNTAGSFALTAATPAPGEPALVVIEANGDGVEDLAVLRDATVDLYHAAGGAFTTTDSVATGLGINPNHMLVAGDVDGDADTDLVVFTKSGSHVVLRRTGPATFSAEPPELGGPATNLADVDGDGDLDGTCCSSGGGGAGQTWINGTESLFEVAINDGTGRFAPSFGIPGLGAHHLAGAADLDGDGDCDLVAGRVVYYGNGPITAPPLVALTASELNDLPVVPNDAFDKDGDGDPDLWVGKLSATHNGGDGSFLELPSQVPPKPAGSKWRGPGYPGDWDGDGDTDLLVSRITGQWASATFESMRLWVNNGAGVFFDGGDVSPPGVPWHAKTLSFPDPYWLDDPDRMVAADADGDGDLDALTRAIDDPADTPAETKVFWNDGTGTFSEGPIFLGETIQAVADLNGDRIPDLILSWGVKVRFGLGGGAFGPSTTLPGSGTDALDDRFCVADLDDDGDVDIAAAQWAGDTWQLWWNDGAGNFTLDLATFAGHEVEGGYTQRISAIDLDDDGYVDLAAGVIRYANNATWFARRTGNGTAFEAPVGQVLVAGAFLDVDGDGDLDALGDTLVLNRTYEGAAAGSRRQYGAPVPGTADVAPVMGARGPFRAGETIEVTVTGVPVGSLGIVTLGLSESALPETPWKGMPAYNWPWELFFLAPSFGANVQPNDGGLTMPYLVDPLVVGIPVYAQAVYADANGLWNRVSTNGLELVFGS